MNHNRLETLLEELKAEVGRLQVNDTKAKSRVEGLIRDLTHLVEHPEDRDHRSEVVERMPSLALHFEVEHLVLAAGANAGTNPIPTGVAIVACGGGSTLITTAPVPFSPAGDAEVEANVSLPGPCLAPVVFFAGVTGAGPRWFAVTGG